MKYLDLRGNQIENLEFDAVWELESDGYYTSLRTLYLNDNKLSSFTEVVRSFSMLKKTEIKSLLPQLQSLDLRGNEFMTKLAAACNISKVTG
jgi:Leucine-rich repeat (LRR) protein